MPRLVPGPEEGGGREQNAVVVIVVRRCARFVVLSGLDSLSFLCDYVENWPFLAIIDRHGYMLSPLKKSHYAVFWSLKSCNPFL